MTGAVPVDSLAEFIVTAATSRLTLCPRACVRACERACCFENCGFAALLLSMVRSGPQGSNLCTLCECLEFSTCGPALVIGFCWSWHCTVTAMEEGFFFVFCFSLFCNYLMMITMKTMIIITIIVKVHFWVNCTWSHSLANTQLPRRRALSVLNVFILTFLYFIVPFAHC